MPKPSSIAFATCVWEKDWRLLLERPDVLRKTHIDPHCFSFTERILVINNVIDLSSVMAAAEARVREGVFTRIVIAREIAHEVFSFFHLREIDFRSDPDLPPDWGVHNALGPLCALYSTQSQFLLYHTGDIYLPKKVHWIDQAIHLMTHSPIYKVANLLWNDDRTGARRESYTKVGHFFISKDGFSDQMFLVNVSEFRQPIYNQIHPDSAHFPKGDTWEKRAFSAMKYRGWERLTYDRGTYIHPSL